MNKVVLRQIKSAIRRGLDEKAGQIIRSRGSYLSRRDMSDLVRYMDRLHKHPYNVIEYVYYASPYRNIVEQNLQSYEYFLQMCAFGDTNMVRLILLENKVDPAAECSNALLVACSSGHSDVVRILLEDGRSNPRALSDSAIRYACMKGHSDVVRILLNDGRADPSIWDSLALRYSVKNGEVTIVRLLLEDGRSDPSADSNDAIYLASIVDSVDIVRLLLKDDRVVRAGLSRAMHMAKYCNQNDGIVSLLMKYFDDPV